jgi:hypothetical protein
MPLWADFGKSVNAGEAGRPLPCDGAARATGTVCLTDYFPAIGVDSCEAPGEEATAEGVRTPSRWLAQAQRRKEEKESVAKHRSPEGRHLIAQGNALGKGQRRKEFSPERATQAYHAGSAAALSGLGVFVL